MEVVSPLGFGRTNQSGKRRFGSPIHGSSVMSCGNVAAAAAAPEDSDMMDDGYGFQPAKRRKRFTHEGQSKENNWSMSPFVPAGSRSPPHAGGLGLPSAKRSRASQHEEAAVQKLQELQQTVEQQAAEIQRLKSEKESVEAAAAQLSAQHAKTEGENKILKRAVAIQQERQGQMTAELEGARQFKVQAEDRVRRLEQMNLTLRYQLQVNSTPVANDFEYRPPDVY